MDGLLVISHRMLLWIESTPLHRSFRHPGTNKEIFVCIYEQDKYNDKTTYCACVLIMNGAIIE